MPAFKRHLHVFFLVMAGCCVALCLAEGFVRICYPFSRDHVVPAGLFEIDDYLGWKLSEGETAIHHSRYFEATYRINNLGYRDKPRNLLKGSESHRILLYGDSQVFGWGTAAEQRFSNLIEDQVPHLEIWNLAVPGYGIDQEVLSYEKQGQLFNADEVFFFVSRATLDRSRYDYIYRKYKPKFVVDQNDGLKLVRVRRGTNVLTGLFYRALSHLYLPYFVDRRLAMLNQSSEQAGDVLGQKSVLKSDVTGVLEKRILERASNVARERKHKITIITDLPVTQRNDLEIFCARAGIGFMQIVFTREDTDITFGEHDGHWNPQTHKLITEQLLSQLEARTRPVARSE